CQPPNAKCTIMNILIIDDEPSLRRTLRITLETLGHRAAEARDSTQALHVLGNGLYDAAFLDLRLAREQGLDLVPELLRLAPGLSVVIITAFATIQTAVEAMRRGAFDYLPKPFTPDQLRLVLERVAQTRRLQSHLADLEAQVRSIVPEADLQTKDRAMQQAVEVALKAAASGATLLMRGESRTGNAGLARTMSAQPRPAAA